MKDFIQRAAYLVAIAALSAAADVLLARLQLVGVEAEYRELVEA